MILGGDSYGFLLNTSTSSMVYEPFMLSKWKRPHDFWLIHYPNYESNRLPYLMTMLADADRLDFPHSFHAHLSHIRDNNVWVMDALDAALRLHNRSLTQAERQGGRGGGTGENYSYPLHNLPKEWATGSRHSEDERVHQGESSRYYDIRRSSVWSMSEVAFYEGFVLHFSYPKFPQNLLVDKGTKRFFETWESFRCHRNWTQQHVLFFDRAVKAIEALPEGPPMTPCSLPAGYVMTEDDVADSQIFDDFLPRDWRARERQVKERLFDGCVLQPDRRNNRDKDTFLFFNKTKRAFISGEARARAQANASSIVLVPEWMLKRIPTSPELAP